MIDRATDHTVDRPGLRLRGLWFVAIALIALGAASASAEFKTSSLLEVHYINVGQGGGTLIIGPDGTRMIYDFGGREAVLTIVPYLRQYVHLAPEDGFHYTVVSHGDRDHYIGYRGLVRAGYQVLIANYGPTWPQQDPSALRSKFWFGPAEEQTLAGAVRAIPLGMRIPLGDEAEAIVVAVDGRVLGERRSSSDPSTESPSNRNDQSVALFIKYRDFQYILDGDLGAGPERCTQHQTQQIDVQSRVARALLSHGLIQEARGVDVMHIAHHGSESSTSAVYVNLMKPEVGLISVGFNQGRFRHPRVDVVDRVLVADGEVERADCVVAPALSRMSVFQTEDGRAGESSTGKTSFSAQPIGDIRLLTDGRTIYTISGSDRVNPESRKLARTCACWRFVLDESGGTSEGTCVEPDLSATEILRLCLAPPLWAQD